MDKNALWKWLILLGLLSFSVWVFTPPKEKIRLGLDLKGGTSFVVKIDRELVEQEIKFRAPTITDEDLKKEADRTLLGAQGRALEVMRNRIDGLGIDEPIIYPGKDNRIIIQLPGVDETTRKQALRSIESVAFLEFRMVHEDNDQLTADLLEENKAPEGYQLVRLTSGSFFKPDPNFDGERKRDRAYREALAQFEVPDSGYEFMLEKREVENQTVYKGYFVKRRRELSGEYLKSAGVDYGPLGQAVVTLRFDGKGGKLFANVTADYAPGGPRNPNPQQSRQLAIVLDGTLYSAPAIREAIYGGRAEISGSFSQREAMLLSQILNAGSLPAPVRVVEQRSVEPSLGQDAIQSGMRAIMIGGVGVLGFMLIYYMLCGVIANIALILNMLLLPLGMIVAAGFMGIFVSEGAGGGPIKLPVLTLPGIAGILLTIGMAVDANVLIFERIREEKGAGKRFWTAVTAGYDRAFVTIMDANITTLLTGIILFIFGSGPIRGFAVTLCAGIMASMFTALVVTKLFFGLIANKADVKALKMLAIVGKTSIDFVAKRKIAAVASVVLIVATWAVMVGQGVKQPSAVFGVDFTGGVSMTFKVDERQSVETMRTDLEAAGLADVYIQYQEEMEQDGDTFLQVKTSTRDVGNDKQVVDVAQEALASVYAEGALELQQIDEVGAQIGKELKQRAVWSIILALLGIVVYISIRFEFGFALGAIVALAHDVLVTVGLYTLFGRQLSLPIVAALLTIVGYSVNDTIVVFDRIREDLKLIRGKNFMDICNLSINQTLSRTILTSLTTLIAVVVLLVIGGGAINDFAMALCIGVLVGTYSSIFVATPVVLAWYKGRKPDFSKTQ
ncbi:MAG: protein translocase subunit SecD [Kiritimatiellia bacterium]|jgi:SecD/SecF fusion protein|nr:protein translocase subunit SecD [Kiritimatiellia bacterium]MDP6630699.1 protein translocase subunit SecD [Kiritimatiellia bacterium]MDP6809438.1 protein translocase subunit SecD [Kiritimatiellia bacterium]MDP7023885.1 protein translocase subunit SecD [Kiritimatiellia bacterium]